VALASPDEVDAELEGWLRDAYDARGLTVDPLAGDHRRADAVAVEDHQVGVAARVRAGRGGPPRPRARRARR
jgi:hypothetical protein